MKNVLEAAARCEKTAVIHFVGIRAGEIRRQTGNNSNLHVADSLAAAGSLAASLSGQPGAVATFGIGPETSKIISEWNRRRTKSRRFLRGVYTGGTLCAEAQEVIGKTIQGISSNAGHFISHPP